ncbi:esterase-like activity of phytase family protein [Elizabethkingia anophelis]|uniref:esterase-like activity of phytase family protein n=1 Tax=Elizabethkingia anophelis TaxID=1117645 RepID=UPI00355668BA
MRKKLLSMFVLAALYACNNDDNPFKSVSYPDIAEASEPKIINDINGVKVYNGGYGSSLVQDPQDKSVFYMLTDRGPNIDGPVKDSKVFSNPDFTPQIGKFQLKEGKLVQIGTILLKNAAGKNLTGLPNPIGSGGTGEIAYDTKGNVLSNDIDGLDSEGLAIAPDGTFWVSDEYGPHIIHFDKNGNTIEKINPFNTSRKIPKVFAKRRPNRGMEGLCITPDGKTLVGIMQFPLYNPSSTDMKGSLIIRIMTFDIATGKTQQFVYLMENKDLQAVSEIAAVDNNTFLVLERDGEYGTSANKGSVFKKVYKIELDGATDVSDPNNGENGKLYNGKPLEQLINLSGLQQNNIVPVKKTLVLDLMSDLNTIYPHDKAEGIFVIDKNTIAISNDDDFGVTGSGKYEQKVLPSSNTIDRNTIYFIKLKKPLK